MMYWEDGHAGGWWFGLVLMVTFWGSLLTLIWVAISLLRRHQDVPPSDAREVLAQRLARGEIEPEEYWRRLEVLGGAR